MFYRALAASLTLLLGSTVLLRFTYQHPPGMSWIDALYFSTETIATVGYGDFSFIDQPTWLRTVRHRADVRRRDHHRDPGGVHRRPAAVAPHRAVRGPPQGAAPAQPRHRRRPRLLRHPGGQRSEGGRATTWRSSSATRTTATCPRPADLDVPVIFGDATLRQTLESARIDEARAVAVLTQDDMVNIETGIVLHEMLGVAHDARANRPDVPDRAAGLRPHAGRGGRTALRLRKRPLHSRSRSAVVHRRGDWGCRCSARSRWDSARSWSAACTSSSAANSTACGWPTCRPRRGSSRSPGRAAASGCTRGATPQLSAGDTAYLVGPYRELLDTLRKGQGVQQPDVILVQRRQVEARAGRVGHRGQPAVRRVLGVAHHAAAVLLDQRTVLSTSSAPRKKNQFDGAPSQRSFVPSIMPRSGVTVENALCCSGIRRCRRRCRSASRTPGGRSRAPWRSRWWSAGDRPAHRPRRTPRSPGARSAATAR